MLPALLTTFLFAISVVCATRTACIFGGTAANFWRLLLAFLLLGIWAHGWGGGFHGAALPLLLLSGFVGFGVGDFGMFQALPKLGSRITLTLMQCLTPLMAAAVELAWLGLNLNGWEILSSVVILCGVAMAMMPHRGTTRGLFSWSGVAWALLGTAGQAGGAVLSRKAYAVAAVAGEQVDGGTAAYQRVVAGLAFAGLMMLVRPKKSNTRGVEGPGLLPPPTVEKGESVIPASWRKRWGWVAANAVAGPVLGVACYQWALAIEPTAVVLPVVATSPLLVIPLAWKLEGERPPVRAMIGGLLAVAGVALLAAMRG